MLSFKLSIYNNHNSNFDWIGDKNWNNYISKNYYYDYFNKNYTYNRYINNNIFGIKLIKS